MLHCVECFTGTSVHTCAYAAAICEYAVYTTGATVSILRLKGSVLLVYIATMLTLVEHVAL
jgi:hypothetical protein